MKSKNSAEYIERARQLAEQVSKRADEIDDIRRIPADLAGEMADAGMFRLLIPETLGGVEIDYPSFVEIVRTFAQADGSTAWCVSQNNIFATDSARMLPDTAREIWGPTRGIVTNGPPSRDTVAVAVERGYRLTGHWDFSSGSSHSTWLAARSPVEGRDGEPPMFLMPKSDVTMLDTWQVNGLRGTASFSFEADDVFVPESHVYMESDPARDPGPIYVLPKIPMFAIGFATIALALARECLNDAVELARSKTQRNITSAMVDRSTVHRQVGEAEALFRATDAYVRQSSEAMWAAACDNGELDMDTRIEVRMASTHGIRTAVQVADTAYDMFGAGAIFKSNPIQRRWQDVHTIAQQIQGRTTNFETAGRYFLGLGATGML
jgi:alkylation response protein AidB-like acyl-CoA dehydrogenase